jgi:hypothetical protein
VPRPLDGPGSTGPTTPVYEKYDEAVHDERSASDFPKGKAKRDFEKYDCDYDAGVCFVDYKPDFQKRSTSASPEASPGK